MPSALPLPGPLWAADPTCRSLSLGAFIPSSEPATKSTCPPFLPQVPSSSGLPPLKTLPLLPHSPDSAPSMWHPPGAPGYLLGFSSSQIQGRVESGLHKVNRKSWRGTVLRGLIFRLEGAWLIALKVWSSQGISRALSTHPGRTEDAAVFPSSGRCGRKPSRCCMSSTARHRPLELFQPSWGMRHKCFVIM